MCRKDRSSQRRFYDDALFRSGEVLRPSCQFVRNFALNFDDFRSRIFWIGAEISHLILQIRVIIEHVSKYGDDRLRLSGLGD